MKVLVTGFEPFGGESVNPSWEIARTLDRELIGGARVVAHQLPCVFGRAQEVLAEALAQGPFTLVVALGLAGSRTGISVERVAINVNDARIPDNAGQQPIDTPVVPGGPADHAGIKNGDLLLSVNNHALPSFGELMHQLYRTGTLLKANYEIERGGVHLEQVGVILEPADLSNRATRLRVHWDAGVLGITGTELVAKLDAGTPRIMVFGDGERPNI